MFCYQCEQTAKNQACTVQGVCGKDPQVAALQDALTYAVKGLAVVAHQARQQGVSDPEANRFTAEALFSTLTNVDFDAGRFPALIARAVELRQRLAERAGVTPPPGPAQFQPEGSLAGLEEQGQTYHFKVDDSDNGDIASLQHTLIFGLRGVSAYADHAAILGYEDEDIWAFLHEGLAAATRPGERDLEGWVALVLKCGEINLKTMQLLDQAHTETFGHPEPTQVSLGHRAGPAILVSGHDLLDLKMLLEQTRGQGVSVYTHGEMLPAHGYPELKKFDHLAGHYGTAWQNQGKEFPAFPGAILMTTNCIQKPKGDAGSKMFTTGLVGWPEVPHIQRASDGSKDFSAVIAKAKELGGWESASDEGGVMTGFAHNAVMNVADKVVEAVKGGAIRHFFLVAGCDGARPGRNYYTEFVEKAPEDTVILTLACGKFRFFDKDLGDIGGIPRLLDVGQCNDAYSAIQIALALSEAFGVGVNELPLSMVLSWYEQKAVAILLTLLHLGITDMRLGPSLPAFITPNVLQVLVDNYGIKPISTPEEDLQAILGQAA